MKRWAISVGVMVLATLACSAQDLVPSEPDSGGPVATDGPDAGQGPDSAEVAAGEVTVVALPPSWTPSSGQVSDLPTSTPRATTTATVTPQITVTGVFTPTRTPTATSTAATATNTPTTPPFPYVLTSSSPRVTSNFANTAGCAWSGIAGQVFGSNGLGKIGLTVHVFGSAPDAKSISGSYNSSYGPGGWEVFITNVPVSRTYTVRLETSAGEALSADYPITTIDTCEANLMLIDFQEL